MNRQRQQRVAALFDEAVDMAPAERAAFLDRECIDDEERRAVQWLLDGEDALRARERAGAPPSFNVPLSYAFVSTPAAAPVTAAAGGGSSGGHTSSDPTDVEMPSGGASAASMTGVTEPPSAALPGPEPRRSAVDIGAVIGRYRVAERLGEGGMGIVFVARHEDLGHDAVVKVLHHWMTDSEESAQRFMDEARIAAGIRHPGVVQVIDVGRHESGALFILMERLYGESLQQRLKREGKLPPRTAISFTLQTARALDAVHARGVVHRDLKPDNLYLVRDPEVFGGERVKILDFGIAKLHSRSKELTQAHVAMGTPPYMAPEQCMGAARVDSRADLYSLGVLLFEMLCGRLPFRCHSFGEYILAHTQRKPPPVQRFTRVSPALARLVARLLAKRPEERHASARGLIEELESVPEFLDGGPMAPGDVGHGTTQEHLPGSHPAKTTPAQPGARLSPAHGWQPGTPPPDTDPEARESSGGSSGESSGGMFVAFRNTRPEPVDEPAATSPVVIEEAVPTSPVIQVSWPSTEPGSKVDTLRAAPGEAMPPAQGNRPAPRSRVMTTLRWMHGLVPAGGLTLLLVAVTAAPVLTFARDVDWPALLSSLLHGSGTESPQEVERQKQRDAELAERSRETRTALAQLFDGGNLQVQRELVDAIRDVGTSEAAELLYQALGGTPEIRLAASHALCALGWQDKSSRLRDAMRRSGGSLRDRLAADLLCLEDGEAIVVLEDALDDDAMIQLIAAEALARAGKRERALPVLAHELAGSEVGSEPWQRAARGLLWLDDAGARAALGGELVRPEPARALAAAEILAEAGDRKALAYLDRVLADAAFTHRAEAALALARRLGDSEPAGFVDRLVAFGQSGLGSPHPHERRAAAAVMGRLAGHDAYLDASELEALRSRLEALRDDKHSTPDAEERAVRITARVALLAVYRALSARKHHE